MKRIPMISGDEYDALTKWHHVLKWHAGERKRIKRSYRRWERRAAKRLLSKLENE